MLPTATFLAGSLLTILLPIALLVALVVWYMLFLRRVPEPADGNEPRGSEPAASSPVDAGGHSGAGS